MFVVLTTVKVQEGSIDELTASFDKSSKQTMGQFATKFAGPPTVRINEIPVEM